MLYSRIDLRVSRMVNTGPARGRVGLTQPGYLPHRRPGHRLQRIFPVLRGHPDLAECTEKLKQATRNYAKRQLTWFRNQNDAVWLYVDEDDVTKATALVRDFLGNSFAIRGEMDTQHGA